VLEERSCRIAVFLPCICGEAALSTASDRDQRVRRSKSTSMWSSQSDAGAAELQFPVDTENTAAFEAASRGSLFKHPAAIAEIRNSAPLKADMSAIACSSDIIMHPVCFNNLANSSLPRCSPARVGMERQVQQEQQRSQSSS